MQCPKCKGTEFLIKAHVTQLWLINECKLCEDVIDDFVTIDRDFDDEDYVRCYNCGYVAKLKKFEE